MKNKKVVLILFIIGLVGGFSSCNNCSIEKQKAKAKIDSLEKALKKPFKRNKIYSDAFPTRNDAKSYTDAFRGASSVQIPLSVRFESSDLAVLANQYPYMRFYFGVQPNTNFLTLIAVGVDNHNVDMDTEISLPGGVITTEMYEFADPCPPCTISTYPQLNSLLYPYGAASSITFNRTP